METESSLDLAASVGKCTHLFNRMFGPVRLKPDYHPSHGGVGANKWTLKPPM